MGAPTSITTPDGGQIIVLDSPDRLGVRLAVSIERACCSLDLPADLGIQAAEAIRVHCASVLATAKAQPPSG
jgi:hypothetical protein